MALVADLPFVQIDLPALTAADDLAGLAADILGAPVAAPLVALLQSRTEGNPRLLSSLFCI